MKRLCFLAMTLLSLNVMAQHLPFGTVFGSKPSHSGLVTAANLENSMGHRTRISVTISGRVSQITKSKGGWFDIDAGNGRVITAHFKNAGVTLPMSLKNRYVLVEGIAQKQYIADEGQHYAGGSDNRHAKPNPKQMLSFEVRGLEVRK